MFEQARPDWLSTNQRSSYRRSLAKPRAKACSLYRRPLAFESLEDRRLLSITVNTLIDQNDGIGVGGISLRDAISAAVPSEMINFSPVLTSGGPATILLTHGELLINQNLTIIGPGANLLTIDASGNDPTPNSTLHDGNATNDGDGSRVFRIDDATDVRRTVSISGLTLTGGDVAGNGEKGYGGAILTRENLTLTGSTIHNNSARRGGGISGIFSGNQNLTFTDSILGANSASDYGGAIWSRNSDLTIVGSTISGNYSADQGGGIWSYTHPSLMRTTTIANSTISGNSAGGHGGGGIWTRYGVLTVTDSTISGNSAVSEGGGIHSASGSTVSVTGSTISGNSAGRYGGGVSIHGGLLTVVDSTISGNSATDTSPFGGYGGGIFIAGTLMVAGSTISGNLADARGGGIYVSFLGGNSTLTSSTITNNEAPDGHGSGVHASRSTGSGRTDEVRSSIIAGNVHSDVDVVFGSTNRFQSNGYNLIGTGNALASFNQPGDQTGVADPHARSAGRQRRADENARALGRQPGDRRGRSELRGGRRRCAALRSARQSVQSRV